MIARYTRATNGLERPATVIGVGGPRGTCSALGQLAPTPPSTRLEDPALSAAGDCYWDAHGRENSSTIPAQAIHRRPPYELPDSRRSRLPSAREETDATHRHTLRDADD